MKRNLRKLLNFAFIALTLAIVVMIAFRNPDEMTNAWEELLTLDPLWLAGAFGCWILYVFSDALSFHYFFRKQNYPISLANALYTSLTGLYYCNITPGASGGQPMQIYHLSKYGVPVGIGTSAVTLKLICNQAMAVLIATVLWTANYEFVSAQLPSVMWIVIIGWVVNFLSVPLILLVAFHRPLVQKVVTFLIRIGAKIHIIKNPDVLLLRVNSMLDTYHASILRLSRQPKQLMLQMLVMGFSTAMLMALIVCVYYALGQSGTPWYQLMTIAYLLYLSASYTPLPGASGAQEGGFLVYFRGLFSVGTIGVALLVWRFVSYYFCIILGSVLTIGSSLLSGKRSGDKKRNQKRRGDAPDAAEDVPASDKEPTAKRGTVLTGAPQEPSEE